MVDFDCKANASYRSYIYIKNTAFGSDPDAARAGLAGVKLVYHLQTPQTYQLTPQAVDALLGENVVFADTGAVSELKYLVKE